MFHKDNSLRGEAVLVMNVYAIKLSLNTQIKKLPFC